MRRGGASRTVAGMRYRWDEGAVTVDGAEIARTGEGFWRHEAQFWLEGHEWRYRVAPEGLIGALDGSDRLHIERGRIWQSTWRMAGLEEELSLTRTTSWLAGKLYFDLHRGTERIAEVVPEGPWMYRPSLEVSGPLEHAEAIFVLWSASRIDARRPLRTIRAGSNPGSGGGT